MLLIIIDIVTVFRLTRLFSDDFQWGLLITLRHPSVNRDYVFRQGTAIYINLQSSHFYFVARQTNNSFDVINLERNVVFVFVAFLIKRIAGIFENDDVAATDFALRQER